MNSYDKLTQIADNGDVYAEFRTGSGVVKFTWEINGVAFDAQADVGDIYAIRVDAGEKDAVDNLAQLVNPQTNPDTINIVQTTD